MIATLLVSVALAGQLPPQAPPVAPVCTCVSCPCRTTPAKADETKQAAKGVDVSYTLSPGDVFYHYDGGGTWGSNDIVIVSVSNGIVEWDQTQRHNKLTRRYTESLAKVQVWIEKEYWERRAAPKASQSSSLPATLTIDGKLFRRRADGVYEAALTVQAPAGGGCYTLPNGTRVCPLPR